MDYRTILRPSEIIPKTGISQHFPMCNLKMIHQVEFYNLIDCFGELGYNTLLNHLVDYSGVEKYNSTTAYGAGDVVKYQGDIYVNLAGSTGVDPTNYEAWTEAPHFDDTCLENMYCLHLGEYLSWLVVKNRVPFIYSQIKAEGIVKVMKQDFESVSNGDLNSLMAAVTRNVELSLTNLLRYMSMNNSTGCFDNLLKTNHPNLCGTDDESCLGSKRNAGYGYQIG